MVTERYNQYRCSNNEHETMKQCNRKPVNWNPQWTTSNSSSHLGGFVGKLIAMVLTLQFARLQFKVDEYNTMESASRGLAKIANDIAGKVKTLEKIWKNIAEGKKLLSHAEWQKVIVYSVMLTWLIQRTIYACWILETSEGFRIKSLQAEFTTILVKNNLSKPRIQNGGTSYTEKL